MKRRNARKFAAAHDGAVTIEFVCTMPLFLAALAFAFEFGQFFLAHQSTVNNVRAASRYLSRLNVQDCSNGSVARAIIRTGRISGGSAPAYMDDVQISCWREQEYPQANSDGEIRVRTLIVRAEYEPILLGFLGGQNARIPFVVREEYGVVRF